MRRENYTKAKTLYIVTAYIGQSETKKGASQLIDAKSPDATPKNGSVVTPNDSIPQNSEKSIEKEKNSLSNIAPVPEATTQKAVDVETEFVAPLSEAVEIQQLEKKIKEFDNQISKFDAEIEAAKANGNEDLVKSLTESRGKIQQLSKNTKKRLDKIRSGEDDVNSFAKNEIRRLKKQLEEIENLIKESENIKDTPSKFDYDQYIKAVNDEQAEVEALEAVYDGEQLKEEIEWLRQNSEATKLSKEGYLYKMFTKYPSVCILVCIFFTDDNF